MEQMRVIQVQQYGEPEELRLETVARPVPARDDLLIAIRAAGVLAIEWKVRRGWMAAIRPAAFPYIPGSAFAGVVAAVGEAVTDYRVGDAVFGRSSQGTYAEYTVVSTRPAAGVFDLLAHKPDNMSFAEAATMSGGATIAWTALFEDGMLQPGQHVLVHGGAGGVGAYAVQFAHDAGAHVTATASTANLDHVRALGADAVIDYTAERFEGRVSDADLVLDTIGGAVFERSFAVVRRGGTIVSLIPQEPSERAAHLGIRAINNAVLPTSKHLRHIADLIAAGRVRAVVGTTLPLSEAAQAHRLSETGHSNGRIVLLP